MPSSQTVLEESTKVAKKAAEQIGGTFKQGVGYTPDSATIPADTLSGTERPISPTQVAPSLEKAGLSGVLESQAKNTAELQKKAGALEGKKNATLEDYIGALMGQKGENELSLAAEQGTGAQALRDDLVGINNDIRTEQQSLKRRLEELDKNPEGLFGGALGAEKDRVERESLSKQADMYIIQQGLQGRFDSAQALADRKVNVQLERQKNVINALGAQYAEYKDLFSTADQRAFEAAQGERKRALDERENTLRSINKIGLAALQNGAPARVAKNVFGAQSIEEASLAAGGYLNTPEVPTDNGINPVDFQNFLVSQALPLTLGTSDHLSNAVLQKLTDAGLPLEVARGIWTNLRNLNDLDTIRQGLAGQFGQDVGFGYLDKFMQTLQGTDTTTNPDIINVPQS